MASSPDECESNTARSHSENRVKSVSITERGADSWFSPGRFCLLLGLCIFAAYPEVVLGIRTFFIRDFGRFGYPLAFHHRASFWAGEIPLWNPLNNFGLPFLAQWNTLVLYPGSLFYLLLPLSWSLAVFCLLHQFWAGVGMYHLARRWTGSHLGAALAGIAFSFNGLTLNSLMWPNNIAAWGWMPWAILCVERGWKRGGRAMFTGAVVAAVQMLAGAPEMVLFTWVFLALLLATELFRDRAHAGRSILRFGWVAVLVSALASIQLFPFLDLLAHSQRNSAYANAYWSMPATGWANFFVPLCHCALSTRGVFFQSDQMWTSSYYAGVVPVVLGIFALWQVRTVQVRLLAAVALAGTIMALGDNGYLFKWTRTVVPALGFVRFPVKFVILTLLSVPALVAHAIEWMQSRSRVGEPINERVLRTVWIGTIGLIAVIVGLAYRYPFPGDDWDATWQNAAFRGVFLTLFLALMLASFRTTSQVIRRMLEAVMVLTLWLDLVTHVPRQNPTVNPGVYEPGLVRLTPAPGTGVSRVMVSSRALLNFQIGAVSNAFNDYLGTRLALAADCNLLDAIPKVNGFFSMYLRECDDIINIYYPRPVGDLSRLTDFLNVSHVTAPGGLFDWESRTNFLPFVTAGQQPVFLNRTQTLQSLCARDFDPRQIVCLPVEARGVVGAGLSSTRVRNRGFSAHRGEVEVTAPKSSLVVVSQAYYHPWRAYVDDRPAKIWRANYAFQALEVPAGQHRVIVTYQDDVFHAGATISFLALAGCGVMARRVRPAGRTSSERSPLRDRTPQ